MEELYGSFDATGTVIFIVWTTDIRVQIKVDGDLPPGDKLLILSAPYRSPLSLSKLVCDKDHLQFSPLATSYPEYSAGGLCLPTTLLHRGPKLPNAHLRLGYNSGC